MCVSARSSGMTIEGCDNPSPGLGPRPEAATERRNVTDREKITTCQALIAELNRSIDVVTAEISARTSALSDTEATKRNRRFISAKAAALSEAADIARTAARQLVVARTVILD